jgi:hypothetical protein
MDRLGGETESVVSAAGGSGTVRVTGTCMEASPVN